MSLEGVVMNETNSGYGGMGLVGWLTLLFVGLKLTGFIDWAWLWVLSPLWISFGAGLFILAVIAVMVFVKEKD